MFIPTDIMLMPSRLSLTACGGIGVTVHMASAGAGIVGLIPDITVALAGALTATMVAIGEVTGAVATGDTTITITTGITVAAGLVEEAGTDPMFTIITAETSMQREHHVPEVL